MGTYSVSQTNPQALNWLATPQETKVGKVGKEDS
jgi:hypothetical protein